MWGNGATTKKKRIRASATSSMCGERQGYLHPCHWCIMGRSMRQSRLSVGLTILACSGILSNLPKICFLRRKKVWKRRLLTKLSKLLFTIWANIWSGSWNSVVIWSTFSCRKGNGKRRLKSSLLLLSCMRVYRRKCATIDWKSNLTQRTKYKRRLWWNRQSRRISLSTR